MIGTNVGTVFFDMKYNQGAFDKAVNKGAGKLQSTFGAAFTKIGAMAAVAFSAAAIGKFIKSAIQLGSDLTEVQNVVDVTFGQGAQKIDKFATSSMKAFGLSELSAKQYTGTMGAMLKSMGLTSDKALDMSTDMAALAGDIASFYNLNTDEAFNKIRSGISGETEPLKQLGINMNIANLEAYSLSQGITKAYSAMTQSEQAMIRYNYLMSVTADAQGDFARNAGTWANQIRILQLQWDSFKSSMGQAFIAVLTPVLQGLNTLMGYLVAAANTFKNFIALITGTAQQADTTAKSAAGAASALGGVGDAAQQAGKGAKKGAKEAKGALAAFDELNNLNINDNDSGGSGGSGGGGGGGGGGGAPDAVDFGQIESDGSVLDGLFKDLLDRGKELFNLFKDGFKAGLGDDFEGSLARMKGHLTSIRDSLVDIFTDPVVTGSFNGMLDKMAYALGQVSGSMVSIGMTIGENLLGGVDLYLTQNSGWIKERFASIFDARGETAEIVGNVFETVAEIFEVFRGDKAKQISADFMGIFANTGLGLTDLGTRLGRDFMDALSKPILENKDQIREAIDNTLTPIETVMGTLRESVTHTFDTIFAVYESKVRPAIQGIGDAWSSIVGTILTTYNTHIAPVLQRLGEKFSEVWQGHIQPMVDKFINFIGTAATAVSAFYQGVIAPFINWLIETLVPILVPIFETIWSTIMTVVGSISDILGGLWDILSGFIDFIVNIFSGNWEAAWEGIKLMFQGFVDAISGLISGLWEFVAGVFTTAYEIILGIVQLAWETIIGIFVFAWETLVTGVTTFWEMLVGIFTNAGENLKWLIDTVWNGIKTTITNVMNAISTFITSVWTAIKNTISTVINAIKTAIDTVFNAIKTLVTSIFTNIYNFATNIWSSLKDSVVTIVTSMKSILGEVVTSIKTTFVNVFEGMKSAVINIFNGIWNGIKGVINGILGGVETLANGVVGGVNTVIRALNTLKFGPIPDWIPGIGGKSFGFTIPTVGNVSLPRLAKGGLVDQPTVAMIGEAGKEAVVPLENNTGWMVTLANILADAIIAKLMMAQGGNGQYNQQSSDALKLEIDGREMGEVLLDHILAAADRRGMPLVLT